MTAQPTSDVNAEREVINHPRHYNTHPSGIECVEYSELLPGNLSHVCVYVWRHAHKGTPAEDLQKAIWFLDRELSRSDFEISDARDALGLTIEHGFIRIRSTDRLRHLLPFYRAKEFVARVVFLLFKYELPDARSLISLQLKALKDPQP